MAYKQEDRNKMKKTGYTEKNGYLRERELCVQGSNRPAVLTMRNRIEIGAKGLILAVVVIATLILCGLALVMVNKAQAAVNSSSTQYSEIIGKYSETACILYDNSTLTGQRVIEVIDEYTREDSGVSVTVVTKMNKQSAPDKNGAITTDAKTYSHTSAGSEKLTIRLLNADCTVTLSGEGYTLTQASDRTDPDYINPLSSFLGSVHKNPNGVVDNILFVQQ